MSFFFNDYIKENTPFGKGLYTIKEMHECWMAGQMSVMKFVEIGGSLAELKDINEAYRELEKKLDQLGHIDEHKHNIRKFLDEKEKIRKEKEKIDGQVSKVIRSKLIPGN